MGQKMEHGDYRKCAWFVYVCRESEPWICFDYPVPCTDTDFGRLFDAALEFLPQIEFF